MLKPPLIDWTKFHSFITACEDGHVTYDVPGYFTSLWRSLPFMWSRALLLIALASSTLISQYEMRQWRDSAVRAVRVAQDLLEVDEMNRRTIATLLPLAQRCASDGGNEEHLAHGRAVRNAQPAGHEGEVPLRVVIVRYPGRRFLIDRLAQSEPTPGP